VLVALLVLFRPIAGDFPQTIICNRTGEQCMCNYLMMMCSCDDQLIDEGDEAL
jgi:hypothetical protein